ncbi:serine/threonine protein kinase [Yersinia enterocolitica]|uniref:serine/threonine protein kinase n=1 Tax=Yersinia enterocolitica TaxID=630 RepID=UPI003F46DE2F
MKIEDILDRPFTFTKRPQLIPCEMRPLWKASLIMVIFGLTAKNNACSLKKVHVANWISKSKKHFDDFIAWNNSDFYLKPEIRLDPTLDRTLELLLADGFLEKTEDRIKITESGLLAFNKIITTDGFAFERKSLTSAKKYLSEASIDRIFKVR